MPLNRTDFADNVSIVDDTKITMGISGKYNIMFSSQLEKGDAGTDLVSVWLTKNGLNLAWTITDVGTYFQLMMTSTTSSQMVIRSVASQTNPTRPEIPATILTVHQVG